MFNFFKKKQQEDVKLFYHTDVHCHILPGVDHGSKSVEQSLEMLKAEKDMGIDRVILTSHVTADTFENTPETLNAAFEILKKAVEEEGLDMDLRLSAEYRIDEYWQKEYAAGHVVPMPGKHILLENSFVQELIGMDEMIFDLMCKGYKPILAHPERYPYYSHHHDRYEKIHSTAVKFQINILSFTGYFGGLARETALWLVKNNMVDMLGSDMHNMDHAYIIKDFLKTKEWRKLSEKLQGHILNDMIH